MKYKINKELFAELIHDTEMDMEYISLYTSEQSIILWTKDDAFKLAYKLMSLASEMK